MILTQTFYSNVSGLVVQRECQALEETMALAQSVLKQAHRRGVELEGILEVGIISRCIVVYCFVQHVYVYIITV